MVFEYIALALALIGLLWFALAVRRLRRRRIVAGCAHGVMAAAPLALAAALALVAVNLYTYARLTLEKPVARLHFEKLAPERFAATLVTAEGRRATFRLAGDEWQLDARVLKWQGWANLLGLHTLYRLERLSGRYETAREARRKPRTVISLTGERGIDLWSLVNTYPEWIPLVDARYGSATYLPMRDGASYRVTITTSGLVARPINEPAQRALESWQ